jgi:tripartite-type tricarboxylate transporter receptor subunit TctC
MKMKNKFLLVCVVLGFFGAAMLFAEGSRENSNKYPVRPINVIVHSSAGGGSDIWARKVSALMEKELGVKMIVSNKGGGNGGIAANYVWNQAHDGYTLLGASETAMTYVVIGAFDKNALSWDWLISGGSPGVIVVLNSSPFKTFQDLVTTAKAKPDTVKVGNSGIGKLWHLKVDMICKYADVPLKHSPYNGSAPAIVALLSKEVDAVSCSAGEAAQYIESGEVRPLVMTENHSFTFKKAGVVPAVTGLFPELSQYLPMSQFLCLVYPNDVPQDVKSTLENAFKKIMDSKDMKDFITEQLSATYGLSGSQSRDMAAAMERNFSWFTYDLGLAKADPLKAGITRP